MPATDLVPQKMTDSERAYLAVGAQAFRGASWLALFKFLSQVSSWIVTVLVAKILVPSDYGLMDMATIITGYAGMFNELGLGSAIIQRREINQKELSSVFWFSMCFSIILASLCFVFAYPTALIFNEPRVIPFTQATSALFIFGGLQIVPLAKMKKDLKFKKIGFIDMSGVLISCGAMYGIAVMGGGTWTLIGGHIVREFSKLILTYHCAEWFPGLHFSLKESRSYLSFGIKVSLAESLFYVYDKSDKFFAGRAWNSGMLGLYSFAMQLAKMPTEKIVVLINQVSYPVFAKLQDDPQSFRSYYLDILKITSTIVIPIFSGAFLLGDEIIKVILNENWYPMIYPFKILCLAQIVTSLNAINNFVHTAQGRPEWSMYFNLTMAISMPISFYFAVQYGFGGILIPWLTTYLLVCCIWIVMTMRKIGISIFTYLKTLLHPFAGSVAMIICLTLLFRLFESGDHINVARSTTLIFKVALGGLLYTSYLWVFDSISLKRLYALLVSRQ